ncbi:MarR family winged helix-turn-helix transcriptional regulator [Desulfogranum mediterraneum]|uniref:MarR family winged helix-turn-helix transcriptional regulator n=1 Tax=Desulfogranum mediterraneum TaxID=160661 RepID=UPI001E508F95|nr:MarR family transcriptional regulator [Desulfogranum mediterraneum]
MVFRAIQAHSKYVEKECGLSSAKLWMLYELNNNPGLKVSQLASLLTIHPSTCSNMLDKLQDRGLVYRDRSKQDQRAVHLYLTEDGIRLLKNAPQPAQGTLSNALEQLPEDELRALEEGLEKLVPALTGKGKTPAAQVPIAGE